MTGGGHHDDRAEGCGASRCSTAAISKYTTTLFGKLGITDDGTNNRRVLAVPAYLNHP